MKSLPLTLHKLWTLLRRLSGDDAYERYLEHWSLHHTGKVVPLDRATFLHLETERRWNGVKRCC